ncbi:hypothetical protein EMIT0158MI4_160203 [Burkholderia ambifaria]
MGGGEAAGEQGDGEWKGESAHGESFQERRPLS